MILPPLATAYAQSMLVRRVVAAKQNVTVFHLARDALQQDVKILVFTVHPSRGPPELLVRPYRGR